MVFPWFSLRRIRRIRTSLALAFRRHALRCRSCRVGRAGVQPQGGRCSFFRESDAEIGHADSNHN